MKKAGKKIHSGAITIFMLVAALVILLMPLVALAGDAEPSTPPGTGTMKTLDEIPPTWSQKMTAAERFEIVLDGEAVLDKETGLVWAKNANLFTESVWFSQVWACYSVKIGGRMGWRLPSVTELTSLIDPTQGSTFKLPDGHPFENIQTYYWATSPFSGNSDYEFAVQTRSPSVTHYPNTAQWSAWPVRSGTN